MKKFFRVIICAVLVVCLCACGKAIDNTNNTVNKEEEKELIELNTSELGDIRPIGLDSNEKYTALFYCNYIEEVAEDTPVEELEPLVYHISVFDTKKNKLLNTIEFDNPDNYWYKLDLDKDITLKNQDSNEIITYDIKLENKSEGTYQYEENYKKGEKIGIDISRFNCMSNFATSTSFGYTQSMVFYDNPEVYYMLKYNAYYDYRHRAGNKIFLTDNEANKTDELKTVLRVFDFENLCEINSISIPNKHDYNNIDMTNFNEKRATVSTNNEYGKVEKIYVWNYNLNEKNKPFDNEFCQIIQKSELNEKIKQLENKVSENYGIGLECYPDKKFIREEHKYSNDFDLINVYQMALDLEYYISLLPKELFNQIICADLKDPVSSFDEFRMYLVGSFPDQGIDAYASNIGCDETDDKHIVYIVYSCSGLNQKTFFHELMHTMEYRIWNYEKDFDDNWTKLNPKGFDYSDDYADVYYDDKHESWQDSFARDYGMKSMLEDRATCFEDLCDGCLSENNWWAEKPELVAKEKYLTEVLEKSFPCFANDNIWKTELEKL